MALPLVPASAGLALHVTLLDRHADGFRVNDALDALDLYIRDAGDIKHFSAREVVQIRTTNGVTNRVPTPLQWQNIVPTLKAAEWVRSQFGNKPVRVHSGYRSGEYNAAVGGAPNSLHRKFNALDISISGVEPRDLYATLARYPDVDLSLGLYDWGVHLDTRVLLDLPRWRSHG